jgi:uncharacterized protein with NRDE domain
MHRTAAEGVAAVSSALDPTAYNPCWLLVGDRESLFFVGISGGSAPEVEQLGPGLHVLENAPLQPVSAKAAFVRGLVTDALARHNATDAGASAAALATVLGDHRPAVAEPLTDALGRVWPASVTAACVHAEGYGTRSAMIVSVPAAASAGAPSVLFTDGPPCQAPMRDATGLWSAAVSR